MSKRLTEGFRLYGNKDWMDGINHTLGDSAFKKDPRTLFKKIFVEGVGEKAIDAIEGDLITINTGYKAIDDHVIYEVFDDEKSVLTTLKKVNATQLQSSESLAGFSAGARLRVPPIGLELVESDENTDKYKTASGGLIVISKALSGSYGQIGVEVDGVQALKDFSTALGEFFFVSENSIYFIKATYTGFTKNKTGIVELDYSDGLVLKNAAVSKIQEMLYPRGLSSGQTASRGVDSYVAKNGTTLETRATVLSKVFVGEDREELPYVYTSSSSQAAPDFVRGASGSREWSLQFIKDGDDTIAVNIDGQTAILGKLARLV